MKIKSLRKEKTFIPKFNGNLDLPDEEQVKVEIKSFPWVTEAQQYKQYSVSADGSVRISYNDSMLLTRHVGKISNLEDGETVIKDGNALANSTNLLLDELVSEIRNYILESGEPLEAGEK